MQDLGKSASDLLLKDYPIQGTSLEVKTLTPSNVTFKVAGQKDSNTNAIAGDIEGKYVDFKNGLIFTQVSCDQARRSSTADRNSENRYGADKGNSGGRGWKAKRARTVWHGVIAMSARRRQR